MSYTPERIAFLKAELEAGSAIRFPGGVVIATPEELDAYLATPAEAPVESEVPAEPPAPAKEPKAK
jgi:hypothetical protein